MENEEPCRPVPAPRRLYPEVRKFDYENVTVDNINKNLNINSENLHNNNINCNDKVPKNKTFLANLTEDEPAGLINNTSKSILTETNDLYGPNANENVPNPVSSSSPTPSPRPRKPQNNANESNVNELYENVKSETPSTPTQQHHRSTGAINKNKTNANQILRKAPELPPKTYLSLERDRQKQQQQQQEKEHEEQQQRRASRRSISSEVSTTSSYNVTGVDGSATTFNLNDSNFSNNWTPKSASNATLNSSLGDSNESAENAKYKSPSPGYVDVENEYPESHICDNLPSKFYDESRNAQSLCKCENVNENDDKSICESAIIHDHACNDPTICTCIDASSTATATTTTACTCNSNSTDTDNDTDICTSTVHVNDLLKSLGTTSKLLTESIGERVATKARGARHKLDKNLRTSTELLSNLSTETTTRLKNVSKIFGTNLSLNRKDPKGRMPEQCIDIDRPQTLPPNDQVFNTISFSSPLNRKANVVADLSSNFNADCSYEIPRNLKLASSHKDLTAPPSYEEALKSDDDLKFPRNEPASKSLMIPKHISDEAASLANSKQRQTSTSLNCVNEEKLSSGDDDRSSRDSMDVPSLPMPTFPPPALPKEIAENEHIYGKVNAIQAPARLKRRKNYEQVQLRRVNDSPTAIDGISLRANVDSDELHKLNMEAAAAEREESMLIRQMINEAELCTPKPDRSESWEYVDNDEEDSGDRSSPEPVYANHEATYGRVFEMATSNKDLLAPKNTLRSICEEGPNAESTQCIGAVGGSALSSKNIIDEFDPLNLRRSSTIFRSEKSNELLLLENLLERDTYGTVQVGQHRSDDDVSMCTSEEENTHTNANSKTSCAASPSPSPSPSASASASASCQKSASQPLTVVLPTPQLKTASSPPPSPASSIQIVHQNAQLLSDSMENIVDEEEKIKSFLSYVEEKPNSSGNVDLSRPSTNRTNWFVQDNKENSSNGRSNPFNKLSIHDVGESPPTYLEAIGADGSSKHNEQKSRTQRFMNSMNVFTTMKIHVDALKRKTSFRNSQKNSDVKVTLQMVPRPSLSPLLIRYEGPLIRFPSGVVEDILKEMQNRKAILRDRQFQTFLDQEMKTAKESIPLEYITTIQCVSNNRVTDSATHFYCFEITTTTPKNGSSSPSVQIMSNPNLVMTSSSSGNCKHQRVCHLYGVGKESERGIWMQKLLESLTNTIPPKFLCHYYRAGWCYLKNSITSEWSGTWLVLKKSQRRLIFVSEETMNVEKMDLRKARCIVLKESDETIRNLHVETGPTLMIDCPPFTVYLIMSCPRETKIWRHIIREVAHNNGFSLTDQQLTKFNVPVIVDKCINFVYIHGSMSEGIYRKSGSENSILKLMSAFRADAFNVEITRNEYNEHDVANVLKRFMRDLPERLLGKMSESFMCVTEIASNTEKISIYKELLARLGVIERETLKKIVGHLAFISSQKTKNKMSIQNLTMIWGPTLMQNHAEEMIYSQKESDVLTDLIKLYKNLFPLMADEVKKEQEMLICLQKYYAAAETLNVKKSGDLKIWITLNPNPENTTKEKTQINVTISPTKTAYEVCKELAEKMGMQTHQVSLYEVILNDNLERPLHHETKLFNVVLNWSYWPEEDRKNNYLVVKPIDFLREVQRAIKNLATVTPSKELKFADNRTKSMKSYLCELRDGKIVVSKKDKSDKTTIVREIFLQSTTAYLGCEKKRDFSWSWAITFVERTQTQILRSRESPFIGHVLAGSEWMDRTIWFSSIWYCLYGESILPPAEIIIK